MTSHHALSRASRLQMDSGKWNKSFKLMLKGGRSLSRPLEQTNQKTSETASKGPGSESPGPGPSSDLVVQVVKLQSGVVSSVKRLHRLTTSNRQSQRDHSKRHNHERHHATLQCSMYYRCFPVGGARVLEDVVSLYGLLWNNDETCRWSRPRG